MTDTKPRNDECPMCRNAWSTTEDLAARERALREALCARDEQVAELNAELAESEHIRQQLFHDAIDKVTASRDALAECEKDFDTLKAAHVAAIARATAAEGQCAALREALQGLYDAAPDVHPNPRLLWGSVCDRARAALTNTAEVAAKHDADVRREGLEEALRAVNGHGAYTPGHVYAEIRNMLESLLAQPAPAEADAKACATCGGTKADPEHVGACGDCGGTGRGGR